MEIERKYLIRGHSWQQQVTRSYHICQGYLSDDPERSVRVRLRDDEAFLTIKAASHDGGLSRQEFEYPIPIEDARELLKITKKTIEKTRHIIPLQGTYISADGQPIPVDLKIELDVFEGDNQGLIMAEVELPDPHTTFPLPEYFAEEVTGVERYYNLFLATHPFNTWF